LFYLQVTKKINTENMLYNTKKATPQSRAAYKKACSKRAEAEQAC